MKGRAKEMRSACPASSAAWARTPSMPPLRMTSPSYVARREPKELLHPFVAARQAFVLYPGARNAFPAIHAMIDVLVERFELAPWHVSG